jgi:drug/metabolite transporter (DMT)-like permease
LRLRPSSPDLVRGSRDIETPRVGAPPIDNPGQGVALKIASTFVFTLMLVCVKALSDRFPPGEIVFARSLFALVPIVAMLMWRGDLARSLRTDRPWMHVRRGAVGLFSMSLSFSALAFLPLPEAMMIGYASPLMIVILASLMLGERVRLFRWSAVAVGFAGIIVILWPSLTLLRSGNLERPALFGAALALLSTVFSGFAGIFVRSMARTESTGTIVFYFSLSCAVMSLASVPFGWVAPHGKEAALLLAMGLLGGVGQLLMTAAYRRTAAATVASFEYVSILWGVAFGYTFFNESLSGNALLGGAIVVAAGIFIILRERRLGARRSRAALAPAAR